AENTGELVASYPSPEIDREPVEAAEVHLQADDLARDFDRLRAAPNGLLAKGGRRFGGLRREDRRATGAQHSGLLPRDGVERRAEKLLVVERDRGDHGESRVGEVRRVE